MWENILTVALVIVAVGVVGWAAWRTLTGKGGCSSGCCSSGSCMPNLDPDKDAESDQRA